MKFICLVTMLVAVACGMPLESVPDRTGLTRPSPINPEVLSDPKPKEGAIVSEKNAPFNYLDPRPSRDLKNGEHPASSTTPSSGTAAEAAAKDTTPNRRVPVFGERLISELSTPAATSVTPKSKRSATNPTEGTTPKALFRRDKPTTEVPSSHSTGHTTTTTTVTPVSVKTPIVHPGPRTKREEPETTATPVKTTNRTTYAPQDNHNDDNEGPHYVRPVPVEQILKNLSQTERPHSTTEAVKTTSAAEPEHPDSEEHSSEEHEPHTEKSSYGGAHKKPKFE